MAWINYRALQHNLKRVRQLAPNSSVLAMVKGNAYGHGMLEIAKHLQEAEALGVATLEEGIALRQAGVKQPIVLTLGFADQDELTQLLKYQIQPVVYRQGQVELLKQTAGANITVWLKVNTGMHRYGFTPEEAKLAWQQLQHCTAVNEIIWMSHFACADQLDHPLNTTQQQRFAELTQHLDVRKSFANSAAILQFPKAHYDIVRPGLMLFGVSPIAGQSSEELGLHPVMTLTAGIQDIITLKPGEVIGYGATYQAESERQVAVVSVGYADGYPQQAPSGTPVWVKGQLAQTLGRVSMDTLTIDITDCDQINIGDSVTLWGKELPAETIAKAIGMSPYALLTGVSQRVLRQPLNQPLGSDDAQIENSVCL